MDCFLPGLIKTMKIDQFLHVTYLKKTSTMQLGERCSLLTAFSRLLPAFSMEWSISICSGSEEKDKPFCCLLVRSLLFTYEQNTRYSTQIVVWTLRTIVLFGILVFQIIFSFKETRRAFKSSF